jgi:hypothetical protein
MGARNWPYHCNGRMIIWTFSNREMRGIFGPVKNEAT